MTNRALISRLRNAIKEHANDSVLSNKHLYNILFTNSITLMKKEFDKKSVYFLSEMWKTACIEMEEVSSITCKCVNLPIGCKLFRSKEVLPEFVEGERGFYYKTISSIDNSNFFHLITPYQYDIKGRLKWNKKKYAFVEDGYLYTPNSKFPMLKIVGWFKKKPKVSCEETSTNCSMLDDSFPAPDYLLSYIIQASLQELGIFKQTSYDHVQDKNTLK